MGTVGGINMGDIMIFQIIFLLIIIAIIVAVISAVVVMFKRNERLSRIEEKLDKLLEEKKDENS